MSDTHSVPPQKQRWHERDYPLKGWVLTLIIIILLVGFIFPLFAEVIIGTYWPCHVKGVEVWNQFTSVVLGIIATVLSIVSIIMGFKSYDDSAELSEKCIRILERTDTVATDLRSLRDLYVGIESEIVKNPNSNWKSNGDPPSK